MSRLPVQLGRTVAAGTRAAAVAAALLALLVLWSWIAGVNDLLALSPRHVPMAPSTALALFLLGAVAIARTHRPPSPDRRALPCLACLLVALVGAAVVARHALGWRSPLEEWLSRTAERLDGIPLSQMSALTGALLLVLALAFLLVDPAARGRRGALAALAGLAFLALLVSAGNSASYLLGRPWLSGTPWIPMAFSTGIVIGLLALALLGLPACPRDDAAHPPPARRAGGASLPVALGLALLIAAVGALYLRQEQAEARDKAHRLLEAIGKLKVGEIASWREERMSDARFFSSAPFVAKDVAALLANPTSAPSRKEVLDWLTLLKGGNRYAAVTLLDREGKRLLAVEEPRPVPHLPLDLVAEALARGAPVMSDFRLEPNGVHMDLVFPILAPGRASGHHESLGSIVLCIDPRRFLFPLLQAFPTPSRSAETLLFCRQGNEVVYLNELRHRANSALTVRFPLRADSTLPAVRALMGHFGVLEGNDYRGVPVLACAHPVDGSPWHVIAKMDREELYAPLHQQAWLTVAATFLLALAAALMVRAAWERRARAGERERLALAERYRVLFETMRNGFSLCRMVYEGGKPVDFVYLAVNPALGNLTGLKDVVGKRVTQVVPGILETNPELFELYGRVAKTGKPEQLETFVPGLGLWFSLSACSSEPGTFAVFFENVTPRKTQEKEIARLTRLYATLSQINQAIVRVRSREELFREVCRVTAEFSGFALAWVGWLDPATHRVLPVGTAGPRLAYLRDVTVFADDRPEGRGPVGTCIREGTPQIFNDFAADPRAAPWHAAARAHGLRSAAALPIRFGGTVCGAFVVYADEPGVFRDKEIALLEEAAMDISFGLDHLAEEEKRKAAEVELQRHRDLLEQTGRIASVGGWEVDAATGEGFWTEEVARIHDLPPDARPSVEMGLSFYTEESRPRVARAVREAIGSGKPYDLECELVSAKGDRKWVRTIGHPVFEGGKVVKLRGSLQDVTLLKKAERNLVESEGRFRNLFESISSGVAVYEAVEDGRDFVFKDFNAAGERIEGIPRDRVVGRRLTEVFPNVGAMGLLDVLRRVWKTGATEHLSTSLYADERISGWRENHVYRLASGEVVAVYDDVTARRQAEVSLKESEARFRAIFESATLGIAQADPKTGRFLLANPRMCEITGYSAEELLRLTVPGITHPEDRDKDWHLFEDVVAGRAPAYRMEKRYLRKDGSVAWVNVNMTVLRDAAGRADRTLGVIEDISERRRAEEALKQSEQRLRLSQQAAKAGSWEWDLRTNENFWSEELWPLYGLDPKTCAASYDAWLQSIHPDDRERTARAVQSAAANGTELSAEWRIHDTSGTERWLMARGQPVRDGHGQVVRYLGIVLDITGRKRAEEERGVHERLLSLLNTSDNLHELMRGVTRFLQDWLGCEAVGIRLQDGDDFPYFETRGFPAKFVRLENHLCAFGADGTPLQDAHGRPILECMCGNVLRGRFDAAKPFFSARGSFWTNCTTDLLASTTEADRQSRTRNRCNAEGYESVALVALRVGKTTHGLLQVNDKRRNRFTPERIALLERLADSLAVGVAHRMGQATLAESEEHLRFALETSHTGAWDLNLADHSAFRSLEHDRIFGYPELLPAWSYEKFLEHVLPEDRARVDEGFRRALETHGEWNFECRIRRADGQVRWIWAAGRHLDGAPGEAPRMAGIVQDVTERKKTHEVLEATNRQLGEAMAQLKSAQQQLVERERLHALGQMASGIAHDFNNALMPVLGYVDLLLKRPERLRDPAHAQRILRLIHTAASDAAQVVRRLREFYRLREQGEVLLPVNLNPMVLQTVELTRPRWEKQSEATGIAIRVETDLRDVPSVYGNEAELREALTNLIFNAVDSMPRGGTLSLRTRTAGRFVELEVADTGTGMTEEVRKRCLEPFFSTKGEHGTGLGLSMVHGILRRHEGEIRVESEPGKGSAFILSLPAGDRPPAPPRAAARSHGKTAWRILVADDDPRLREILLEDLADEGHLVEAAPDGPEALEKLRKKDFDLVICDRAMPRMSGDQVAAEVKRASPSTRFVLLTAFGEIMHARGEHPADVDLVLPKPVSLDSLREALADLMSAGPAARPRRKRAPPARPRKKPRRR